MVAKLEQLAKTHGFTVRYADAPNDKHQRLAHRLLSEDEAGCCHYPTRIIAINRSILDNRQLVDVLVHEIAHVIDFVRNGVRVPIEEREALAERVTRLITGLPTTAKSCRPAEVMAITDMIALAIDQQVAAALRSSSSQLN